ncbi:MAG TPA: hypothetical protein PLI09_13575 [Candidatus Hydrogenedentes bacterium]|nr:hypothetical protein [Candidatus Hydrogenedentota bacterium]
MIRKLITVCVLLYFVVMVRMLTWNVVFTGGDVLPYDSDPYFRLREIQLIAHHFPNAAPEDRYVLGVEKPTDSTITRKEPWLHPSMFLMALVFAGFTTEDPPLREAAMFVPIVWALFTVLAAFWFAWRIADFFAAIIAAIYVSFCMPILWRTSLGALDNHMTESMLFLVLLLMAAALNKLPEKGVKYTLKLVLPGGLLALCALISYWTVMGAMLLCISYSLALIFFANRGPEQNTPIRTQVLGMGWCMLIAGGINVLLANFFSAFCLAGCGAYLLGQVMVWRFVPKGRIIVWGAIVLLGLVMLSIAWPGLAGQLLATGRVALHLSKEQGFTERFYSTVSETQPIPLNTIHIQYSLLILLIPVLVPVMLRKAYKTLDPSCLALCVMTLALLLASIPNRRFSHMAAAVMAPLIAWGLGGLLQFLFDKIPAFSRKKAARLSNSNEAADISDASKLLRFSVKTLVIILMLLGFAPYVLNNLDIRKKNPGISPPLQEVMQWMKLNTPRCENFWNPVSEPPYRVMAKWDVGWWMLDRAQCVPVANNAGEGALEELTFFFNATPEEALDLLHKQNAKYVLVDASGGRTTKAFRILQLMPETVLNNQDKPENKEAILQRYRTTLLARLYEYDGALHVEPGLEISALEHYRLLYESKELAESPLGKQPTVKLFDVVPGAHIMAKAAPGTIITAVLSLESNTGRAFMYTDTCTADTEGNFRLVLPYPTDSPSGETTPMGKWTLDIGGQKIELEVSAELVKTGGEISL